MNWHFQGKTVSSMKGICATHRINVELEKQKEDKD